MISGWSGATLKWKHAAKRALSRVLPYRPMDGGRQLLDTEYKNGEWDYLRNLDELSRFSVVVGYCHHLKPRGAILEVGCGEGLLESRLDPARVGRYLGVDIAPEAIARAGVRRRPGVDFVAADALEFKPRDRFDIVLFNECLEYFDDPRALVARYRSALHPDGLVLVSMFVGLDTARTERIWRMLDRDWETRSATRVVNEHGYAWVIKVLSGR